MSDNAKFGLIAVVLVIPAVAALLTGEPAIAIAVVTLAAVVGAWFVLTIARSRSVMGRHGGDPEAAAADREESVPSADVITDGDTALGDTPQAHNEISPRDLPPNHPGREEAERQSADERGTTRGDDELLDVGPARRRAGRTADQSGRSEDMEGGSPELENPSHPIYSQERR